MESKFYTYSQNNSGGFFQKEENAIAEVVVIEAKTASGANLKAKEIGIYFNGCQDGSDCDCCGDRWYEVDDSDGYDVPSLYGSPITKGNNSFRDTCYVHYLNGDVEKISLNDNQ